MEWKTMEFIHYPKSVRWFLVFFAIILTLTIYAILSGSATMAIVFLLIGGMVCLIHGQEPKIIDIKITEMGMQVADRFYPFSSVRAFWIVYKPNFVTRLYLRLADKTGTQIKIELNQQNPVELRRILNKELHEVEGGEESMFDLLIRLLRLQ